LYIGFILTFGTMHISGMLGMPRRIYTYDADRGWALLNQLKQAGANWVELIGALKENGKLIQQVSSKGLTGFDPGSANESEAWYINLFAS